MDKVLMIGAGLGIIIAFLNCGALSGYRYFMSYILINVLWLEATLVWWMVPLLKKYFKVD